MSVVSPKKGKDPISDARFSLGKHGTPDEKEKASKILRREVWLVNAYVVSDPTNPDNNGKVKLLRYGRQLEKIIKAAISGEDADEFGAKVFDPSANGCNFKIKVERQGDFPTYVSSRFAGPSDCGLDESNIEEVLNSVTDLTTVFKVKSYDEMKAVLDEHFHCKDASWEPEGVSVTSEQPKESKPDKVETDNVNPLDDDKVKELLDGLGD
jgi:hypothetical protein